MPQAVKLSGLVVALVLGVALAWSLGAAGQPALTTASDATVAVDTTAAGETTTDSLTTTEPAETTTEAPSSDFGTTTVQVTTTRVIIPSGAVTTSSSSSDDETETWVWVVIAILAVALVALIALLARRGRGSVPVEERRRHLDGAVAGWAAQGWAVENETGDSTLLRRGSEAMLVSVDTAGHVSTRPLPPPAGP